MHQTPRAVPPKPRAPSHCYKSQVYAADRGRLDGLDHAVYLDAPLEQAARVRMTERSRVSTDAACP